MVALTVVVGLEVVVVDGKLLYLIVEVAGKKVVVAIDLEVVVSS